MKTKEKLLQEVANLKAEIKKRDFLISSLQEQVKSLEKYRFGSSSEKDPNQMPLFNEAEQIIDSKPKLKTKGKKKKAGFCKTLPAELPCVEKVYDLDNEQKTCPNDGTELKHIGEETSEQLLFVPASVKVIKHKCYKYACPQCKKHIVTASKPRDPIPGSIASPELLSYLSVSKYADGLPLYRLSQMFNRLNIKISRTSMADWIIKCGSLVQPLVNLIADEIYNQPCVHVDETTVQVLNEPGKKAQSKSYMWVQRAGKNVLFNYSRSRSQATAEKLLANYNGAIMCDGYQGYDAAGKSRNITRLGCWVHARRYFIKVTEQSEHPTAEQFINLIGQLYGIEKHIRENKYKPDKIKAIRQQQSVPIINQIKELLDQTLHSTAPSGLMGKALGYLQSQWNRLIRYTEDGNYPIDNNLAENAIRPFVIGRKNWLFANSVSGAKASANLYSLIETIKAHGLNLEEYFTHIYRQMPNAKTIEDIEQLAPWNYKPE